MSNNQNCGCGCGCNTPPPQPDGCGCGCGGNCNCGTESTVINFTTQEINQILQDGIINCSVRYTCCCGTLRPFSLSEAITLVPEKYRNVNRIITFLNHDGKPEVWIYSGRTIMDWANPTYWTSIPTSETYSEIYSKISDLELKLQDEALNRANADADLRARIDAIDGGENGEAISAVNTRITQEIEDRKTADDTLRTYFYNLLQDASRDFQNKLDAEAAERDREDHAIREEISKIDYDGIREEFDTKLEEERQYRHSEDERLEGLINGLKGDIEASTPEGFTELVEKVGTIEGEVNTLKTNVSDLSTKVDASEAKVDEVVSDVANNTSAISALDTKVTANETAIDTVSSQVATLDTKVKANEDSITGLNTSVSDLTTKVETNKDNIQKVSDDLASLDSEVKTNTSSISDLGDRVTTVEGKVSTLETDVTTAKGDITTLDGKLDALEKKVDDLPEVDLSGLTQKVTDLETEVAQLTPKVEANETSITELTTKVADNETSVTNLDTRVGQNEGSITNLDTRVEELEGRPTVPEIPEGSTFLSSKTIAGIEAVSSAPVTRANDNILYIVVPTPPQIGKLDPLGIGVVYKVDPNNPKHYWVFSKEAPELRGYEGQLEGGKLVWTTNEGLGSDMGLNNEGLWYQGTTGREMTNNFIASEHYTPETYPALAYTRSIGRGWYIGTYEEYDEVWENIIPAYGVQNYNKLSDKLYDLQVDGVYYFNTPVWTFTQDKISSSHGEDGDIYKYFLRLNGYANGLPNGYPPYTVPIENAQMGWRGRENYIRPLAEILDGKIVEE